MRALPLLLSLLLPGPAAAQDDAATARLGALSVSERALLAPFLLRGPIAFVEFSPEGELPAVILATRVQAPPRTVAALLAEPSRYPSFMPALDRVEVESRQGAQIAYRWRWDTSVFTLEGRSVMQVYPAPPPGHQERGYRIGIQAVDGDLGTGRMVFRVYPADSGSLLVFASRIDMRDANYISRRIASGGTSINRTINMTLAWVMMCETAEQAEAQAGVGQPVVASALPALQRPAVDFDALGPLLARGDLVMVERHGGDLSQVDVVGRMGQPVDPVRAIMTDPAEFGRSLVTGSRARAIGTDGLFEWEVPLPLVGSSGQMRLREVDGVVTVDGVNGSLREGRFRFDTHAYPWNEAAVIGWARFDPADASWLIRRLVEGVPHFGEGLAAAGQLMLLRSVRSRVWD